MNALKIKTVFIIFLTVGCPSINYGMDSIISKKNQKKAAKYGGIFVTGVGAASLFDQLYNEKYCWKQSAFTTSCFLTGFMGWYFGASKYSVLQYVGRSQSIFTGWFKLGSRINNNATDDWIKLNDDNAAELIESGWNISKNNKLILRHQGNIDIQYENVYTIINGKYYPIMRGNFTYENGELRKNGSNEIVKPFSSSI